MPHTARPYHWTFEQVLIATGGDVHGPAVERDFSGPSIDSRRILPSEFFVAIIGENHDGHSFLKDVAASGVRAVVVQKDRGDLWRPLAEQGTACVVVDDTLAALGMLGSFRRKRSGVRVVAVTGSNGKTSTKEMTAWVMNTRFETLSTEGNLNNEVGLPLTLLRLRPGDEWAVLEMGMNHPGEIGRLTDIAVPNIGVITNIMPAHLEGLGDIEGVAAAKGELLDRMPETSTAVLNADDPRLVELAKKARQPVLFYGLSKDAHIRAEHVSEGAAGMGFILATPGGEALVRLSAPGGFMVRNALAAAAAGHAAGLSVEEVRDGLELFRTGKGRMNLLHTRSGIHVIDDTYNANPGSMAAAIRTLTRLREDGRAVFVAGDMKELGPESARWHREIGEAAAGAGLARLYVTGEFAGDTADGAAHGGMAPKAVITGEVDEISDDLTGFLRPGDWVLVKGSRAMRMERIVDRLREAFE